MPQLQTDKKQALLHKFPGFRTTDPEALRQILFDSYNVKHFDCDVRNPEFLVTANWASTKYVKLTSAFCNVSTDIKFEGAPVMRQFFLTDPKSSAGFKFNGKTYDVGRSSPSVIVPPDTSFRIVAPAQQESFLALGIDTQELARIARSLLDEDIPDIDQSANLWAGDDAFNSLRRATMQFARDLDALPVNSPFAADVFSQTLLIRVVMNSEYFRSRSVKPTRSPSRSQLSKVEEFLAANWQKGLNINNIADEFGLSVRSVFRHFKELRGTTPHEYIRQLKLSHARDMLEGADENGSVMSIALRCGFQGMGHFAREYRKQFGELPSQTLRKDRRT